jgi:hypothetical protein
VDGFQMSDEVKRGPYGPALSLQKVNGVGGVTPDIWIRGDDIGAPGSVYPDGTKPNSELGCVKAGKNITIDADGTINSTGGTGGSTDWKDITNKPATFPVAAATIDELGGIKPGRNLTVQPDGTLDASGGGEITPATPTVLGGIKVGQGLNVTGDGTLSTQDAVPNWSDITNKPATFPVAIASETQLGGVKEGAGINIQPDGTISTVSAAPTWEEIENKPAAFPPPVASTNTLGGVKQGAGVAIGPDGTISTNIQQVDWDIIVDKPKAYPPTIASETEIGGVKAGNNISIDLDGTINAAAVDLPIATTYVLGGVKIGAGITVGEDGTIGTEASAPYWLDIVDKPKAFPPTIAKNAVVGGIMPDDKFLVNESGVLSAKPFTGKSFQVVQYNDDGEIIGSATLQNRHGNLILGGVEPTNKAGEEITYGGQITLLDASGAYSAGIKNASFDYTLLLSNGPNIKKGFMPFVTQVENADVSLSFGPIADAIGYATKDKLGVAQVGGNIDVDTKGVISVKTADKGVRGLVTPGASIDVNDGVITPSLATLASPGIVQVGSGLSVDQNGVISTTNAIAFVNKKVFDNNNPYPKNFTWQIPEGVDYFRVSVCGAGGAGGWGNENASTGPGGGGGGGGAYAEAIFYAYKFDDGSVFDVVVGGNSTGGSNGGTSSFTLRGKPGNAYLFCPGGTAGESGREKSQIDKGYSQGGAGGRPANNGIDLDKMLPPNLVFGGDGAPGFSVKNYKGDKTVGGAGGGSFAGPSFWGGYGGYGYGSTGGGEANGKTGVAVAGNAFVIIEW